MNSKQVESFLKLQPQLKSAYDEISLLSKKKPTDALNKFKIKFINTILSEANTILGKSYRPFPKDFTVFDEEEMPNNGDAVFMLSHYLTSFEKMRCDNIIKHDYNWYWVINNKHSTIKTDPPTLNI